MAVTPKAYTLLQESLWEGRINVNTDTLWCMLVTASYTPNQDTHKFKSVITNEVTGSGYTAGGKQITGVQLTSDSATNKVKLTGGNLSWPSVTFTGARYGIVYVNNNLGASGMPLVAYINFGTDQSVADEAFYINWPTNGIIYSAVP